MRTRPCLIFLLFAATCSQAQGKWQLEIMPGVAGYQGDLTQKSIPFKNIGPAAGINLKYNTEDMIVIRAGFAWARLSADDKNNKQADIRSRNLNFKTDIWEATVCAEVNILDPESYTSLPYLFLGIGAFRFNPYTYDKDNKKTYLRPLSTEGQGLPEYPDKKKYSLTQFCVPFGGGWKIKIKERTELSFEIGVRFLFTDYLDDVSDTYASPETILLEKGPKAFELAFRSTPIAREGDVRGNPKIKDMYAFSGAKLTFDLGKKQKAGAEKK